MTRLLIVDDESTVVYSMKKCLSSSPIDEIITCGTGREAIRLATEQRPDVVILDVCLPDLSGLEVFERIREVLPHSPAIIITAFGKTDTAISAMKHGAFEYLVKPVDTQRLRDVVRSAAEVSRANQKPEQPVEPPTISSDSVADAIVGNTPVMQEVYKAIGRVASQDVTALILGESGTGKEVIARAIWRYSHRADGPFVAINCAAIPETLLESELFGYERGAFTGANERRIGKFEYAKGGTVFLDEIGDMSSATQAKVLRVIQEQEFERIGGTQTIKADVRIIAATNKNLAQLAAENAFRQDLYYRINGFVISLPPLRERADDIPLLANHFVRRFNREMGKSIRTITPDALRWLTTRSWPGNVRELQNTIKYAMINAVGDVLVRECFPADDGSLSLVELPAVEVTDDFPSVAAYARHLLERAPGDVYRQVASAMDNVVLDAALRFTKGNQLHAAALLGISRTTLRAKLRSLGRTLEKQLSSEAE